MSSIFYLLHIFLANYSSIMNFLYIITDYFSWHVSQRLLRIWPKGHISGPRVLDFELSLQTHILTLMLLHPNMSPFLSYWTYFWPKSTRSWSFYTDSLTPSVLQDISLYLTYWTYFWTKSSRSLTYYTDSLPHSNVASAIREPIFDLLNIFLTQECSIMSFL